MFNLKIKIADQDTTQLEALIQNINTKWFDSLHYVEDLSRNLESHFSSRKAHEELATLRDVHEGYQRYINNAEPLSNEAQKLNLQLETNKVTFIYLFVLFHLNRCHLDVKVFYLY